jgi:sulfur carrier protein
MSNEATVTHSPDTETAGDITQTIRVNDQPRAVTPRTSIAQLLEQMGCAEKRVAVAVNRQVAPRSAHASWTLEPGDRVDIVQAVGGG